MNDEVHFVSIWDRLSSFPVLIKHCHVFIYACTWNECDMNFRIAFCCNITKWLCTGKQSITTADMTPHCLLHSAANTIYHSFTVWCCKKVPCNVSLKFLLPQVQVGKELSLLELWTGSICLLNAWILLLGKLQNVTNESIHIDFIVLCSSETMTELSLMPLAIQA